MFQPPFNTAPRRTRLAETIDIIKRESSETSIYPHKVVLDFFAPQNTMVMQLLIRVRARTSVRVVSEL